MAGWLDDVFQEFFRDKGMKSTEIVVGLCGEFSGGEKAMLNSEAKILPGHPPGAPNARNLSTDACCCMVVTTDQEEGLLAHMATHGGCDTALLKGKLFLKDGKLCLVAMED